MPEIVSAQRYLDELNAETRSRNPDRPSLRWFAAPEGATGKIVASFGWRATDGHERADDGRRMAEVAEAVGARFILGAS